jgi:DNA-binding NarL/FixJ family response regulator
MTARTRILLVDDHAVVRAGLRALLEQSPEWEVVGEAGSGEEAVQTVATLRPGLVVMDLCMPGMDGIEATRRIMTQDTGLRVLILSGRSEEGRLLQALQAGARGYVRKSSTAEEFLEALRDVVNGDVALTPAAAALVVEGYRSDEPASPLDLLTPREHEIVAMTAAGHSARAVADRLCLSPKTVDTYRSRVYNKVGIKGRVELVRFALDHGLLRADPDGLEAPAQERQAGASPSPDLLDLPTTERAPAPAQRRLEPPGGSVARRSVPYPAGFRSSTLI